ncbi:hypothetical protein F5146DRAFT_1116785 [Armillaria mellea]|nr:hypothetical protein F5146DRAFT_1116785 [Armillaria mellea]
MTWGGGPMAEVTNVPSAKTKMREREKEKEKEKEEGVKEKWWAIGRGRKDSKEKDKPKEKSKDSQRPNIIPRSKSNTRILSNHHLHKRQEVRFNSLDSGALLSAPTYQANNFTSPQIVRQPQPHARTPTLDGLVVPSTLSNDQNQNTHQGSIALRAMRSLARIGSWAQLRNPGNENEPPKYKDIPKKPKAGKKDAERKKKPKHNQHNSTSSLEAGTLTASPEVTRTLGHNKKRSILGLGLPSTMTMKIPAAQSGPTASSTMSQAPSVVDNKRLGLGDGQRSEGQRKGGQERDQGGAEEKGYSREQEEFGGKEKDAIVRLSSRRSPHLFVELVQDLHLNKLLGRARPRGMYEDTDNGALSVLDAVTNDLAMLINTLDLEATPGATPNPSPIARRNTREPQASPTKPRGKTLRLENPSVPSLRPYVQAAAEGRARICEEACQRAGAWKAITPLPVMDTPPPVKPPSSPPPQSPPKTFARTHKQMLTWTSPGSAACPEIAQARKTENFESCHENFHSKRQESSATSSVNIQEVNELENHPIFMRKRASLGADKRASHASTEHDDTTFRRPLAPGAHKMLGMRGTMGGSDVSAYAEDVDVSDPDSDIPDELQSILHRKRAPVVDTEETMDYDDVAESTKGSSANDTMDYHDEGLSFINDRLGGLSFVDEEMEVDVPTPPVFHAQVIDEEEHHAELEPFEEDTNKSFDFTGEIKRTASYKLTFLPFRFSHHLQFPAIVQWSGPDSATGLMNVQEPTFLHRQEDSSEGRSSFDMYTTSQIRNLVQPTLLSTTDGLTAEAEECSRADKGRFLRSCSPSSGSRPSDGELNRSFKFGGSGSSPSSEEMEKPMTLSDIIPPPAQARSLSMGSLMEDDSVLKSIRAKVSEVPRPRVNSDSSSKTASRAHSRHVSGSSFTGLDTFEEVRRGFEFPDNRPTFYPPSATAYSRCNRQESPMSFASVSSYGSVVNPGIVDPFKYGDCGLPSLQEMPSSESLSMSTSMSMNAEDTFGFLRRGQRRRADSDTSSFYFKPSGRGHHRSESNCSVSSQFPPNSRYNRSFGVGFGGGHVRSDSDNSMSSVANSYTMHGANAGLAPWAKHHRPQDSVASEFSAAMRVGRPGIGDKMFDNPPSEDDSMISMLGGGRHERRESIGSIMDIDKSPCVRVEKRKHSEFRMKGEVEEGAVKARIVMKPSLASPADSTKFGGERMIRAQDGYLDRRSLEESCLVADGEDMSFSFGATVFTKPDVLSRSTSSRYTSNSGTYGSDTPPLSSSDGSSMSEGSQSSIDLEEINVALTNATHPTSSNQRNRVRARVRGHGHRRRSSHTQALKSSIYETIQEEASPMFSPGTQKNSRPTAIQPVFVMGEDSASIHSATAAWDDRRGTVALRRYYELREEAESAVTESKRVWIDTPFSLFALQCFDPPKHPAGMQALLEHSIQNYGPLPSELRPKRVRSRTSSRASPYPSTRVLKAAAASPELVTKQQDNVYRNATSSPLGDVLLHTNVMTLSPASKPFSPLIEDPKRESAWGPAATRPRVGSAARRTVLGAKKNNGKTPNLKENAPKTNMTRSESLRLSRPRPKGRPTPARQIRL